MDLTNHKACIISCGSTIPEFAKRPPMVMTNDNVDYTKEVWLSVIGFDGHYIVSNFGNVASLNKTIKLHHGGDWRRKGTILKSFPDKDGYLRVALHKNGKMFQYSIHRLVCMTFMPMYEYKLQVNHKDGNKKNNCIDNLEWCTPQENIAHSVKFGLRKITKCGQDSPWSKLNNNQLYELLVSYKGGSTVTDLAVKYGISREYCRLICRSPKKYENIKKQIDGFYRN